MYALIVAVFSFVVAPLVESAMPVHTINKTDVEKFQLLFKLPKNFTVYALVPIAITLITLVNVVILVILLVIHHKRRPREATEQELDAIEAEDADDDEEEEDAKSNNQSPKKKDNTKATKRDKKEGKPKTPMGKKNKGKAKKMKVQTKEFKFTGQVMADTETLKLVSGENETGTAGASGTKTDLRSMADTTNKV